MHIVTGGAGFIGSAVVWRLNNLGIEDIIVVDNLNTSEKWKNLVNLRYADYLHRDAFMSLVQNDSLGNRIKAVIHMGACSSTMERDADFLMRNNLEYSKILYLFAKAKKARFINASSAATYGDGSRGFIDDKDTLHTLRPLNMYGYSKHLFDMWALKNRHLDDMVSLKFFNVYGPNEQHKGDMRSVVNKAFHQIRETGVMRLFRSTDPAFADGGQMRDFIYVKDCVNIIVWFLQNNVCGIFNAGSGKARTWNDLAAAVFAAMELPANIEYVDMPPHLQGKYQNFTEADTRRLSAAGCNSPMYSLKQGVSDYVRHYLLRSNPHL
ncbi:MAG: ADP-glyceromanno-heptose 6-epimerase [Desulfovibrio sp.]|nr:ADP-glyceromanno-heptose 6-epimerase [Desulfovibrio sp.]